MRCKTLNRMHLAATAVAPTTSRAATGQICDLPESPTAGTAPDTRRAIDANPLATSQRVFKLRGTKRLNVLCEIVNKRVRSRITRSNGNKSFCGWSKLKSLNEGVRDNVCPAPLPSMFILPVHFASLPCVFEGAGFALDGEISVMDGANESPSRDKGHFTAGKGWTAAGSNNSSSSTLFASTLRCLPPQKSAKNVS